MIEPTHRSDRPFRRIVRAGGMSLLSVLAVVAPVGRAHAQIASVPLTTALSRLAREAHLELLFDERLVAGKSAAPDRKGYGPEQRLRAVLAGTGLTYKRTATGAYLVLAVPPSDGKGGQEAPAPRPQPPIADILVTGRRTLNTDIRRDRDDIQAYQIFDSGTIARSQSATLDAFLRSDFLENREIRALDQTPRVSEASVRSQVDVHGLGTDQTLILIDGRRLPRIASLGAFVQPDVNALPLYAIDRIETLGTTAGGIFGIGAAGGAVNIVTKGDYDGLSVNARSGITERGDAAERSGSLHFGVTSPGGHTRVSLRLSAGSTDGLSFGDRPYAENAQRLAIARDRNASQVPVSGSINISGLGQKLTLLPSFGGTVLNGTTTVLPLDAPAIGAGGAALLAANVGQVDLSLSPDGQGALQTYLTPTKTLSGLATLRQDIGDHIVVFGDYLRLQTEGRATIPSVITADTFLLPGQSGNPFAQAILLSFPTVGSLGLIRNRTVTERLTLGAIYSMGQGWSASVDVAAGQAAVDTYYDQAPVRATALNVFAGPAALAAQLAAIGVHPSSLSRAANRLHDFNLKIAGSPLMLPAGRLYLTVTGELREERSPGEVDTDAATPTSPASSTSIGGQRERVASAFIELRAPIFSNESAVPLLRGLELQVAVRHDRYTLTAPVQSAALIAAGYYGPNVTARGDVTAVTAGLRVHPVRGLTLRASFATGYTPPTAAQITPDGFNNYAFSFSDPKRGGAPPFSLDRVFEISAGSPALKPQLARTLSVGAIAEPEFLAGLRVSIDYSRLETSREIGDYSVFDAQYFIDHEAAYPGRVVRAPLSAADIVKGFTAGRILSIDSTYLTVGKSSLDVVDAALDLTRTAPLGMFHVFTRISWEPKLSRRGDPALPSYNSVNSVAGPLSFRASAGLDWSKGPWSAGLNGQAYGAYHLTYAFQPGSVYQLSYADLNASNVLQQGGSGVPAQAYLDGYVGWRGKLAAGLGRMPEFALRLGIKNVLNSRPPTVVPSVGQRFTPFGYSYYGDPRGRQFVLDVSATF